MAKHKKHNERIRSGGPADQEAREPLPGVQPEPAFPPEPRPATEITDEERGPKTKEDYEREALASRHREDERSPLAPAGPPGSATGGIHAVGEWGGGTAIGGLAGSNEGDGTPDLERLEDAAGSSHFDHQRLDELDEEEFPEAYAGPSGGAVGGTPAGKRARGGRTHRGINPADPHPGDSTIGTDPHAKEPE